MGKFARRHEEAWSYLRALQPDIALLQETSVPRLSEEEQVVFRPVYKQWGTAIYVRKGALRELKMPRYPERIAAAVVEMHGITLGAASVHAPIISGRVFPHLANIFDDIEKAIPEPAIVGGDLNSARLCEQVWPGYGHGPFFERFVGGRFSDCHWNIHGRELQTFFRRNSKHPFQDDHIFASGGLAERVKSCAVDTAPIHARLSDHAIVVAEFALPAVG